jgi:hypothetical protein
MRLSPLKNTLAVLRYTIGREMTQKEMGRLVNRAAVTIQKIELNQTPLSEDLATEISWRTGVSLTWLLNNDLTVPITAAGGKPYTKEIFERVQAAKSSDPSHACGDYYLLPLLMASGALCIGTAAISAFESEEPMAVNLLCYRMNKALSEFYEAAEGAKDFRKKWEDKHMDLCIPDPADAMHFIDDLQLDFMLSINRIRDAKLRRHVAERKRTGPLPTTITAARPRASAKPSRALRRRRA